MREETKPCSTLAMLREQVPKRPCSGTKCGKCLQGTWWVLDEAPSGLQLLSAWRRKLRGAS
jgi:hypothetical protein